MENREIKILPDLDKLSLAAAQKFVELAREKIAANNFFTVALAGGSTPKSLYQLLADEREPFRAQIDWSKIKFFWGDERTVAPDSEESNFRMVYENLLQPLGISWMNYYRFKGELKPEAATKDYEQLLRLIFNSGADEFPRFDLILLGMGADAHTASLFPNTEVLNGTKKLVAAPFVKKLNSFRLTLTPQVLNNAANIIFLVAGKDKADALREVLEGDYQPDKYPSQIINPLNGSVTWFVDEAAARFLSQSFKKQIHK